MLPLRQLFVLHSVVHADTEAPSWDAGARLMHGVYGAAHVGCNRQRELGLVRNILNGLKIGHGANLVHGTCAVGFEYVNSDTRLLIVDASSPTED